MSKVKVTFELDLESGGYEVVYNNLSEPGQPIDLTRTLVMMKRTLFDHEAEAEDDAVLGTTGRARILR